MDTAERPHLLSAHRDRAASAAAGPGVLEGRLGHTWENRRIRRCQATWAFLEIPGAVTLKSTPIDAEQLLGSRPLSVLHRPVSVAGVIQHHATSTWGSDMMAMGPVGVRDG